MQTMNVVKAVKDYLIEKAIADELPLDLTTLNEHEMNEYVEKKLLEDNPEKIEKIQNLLNWANGLYSPQVLTDETKGDILWAIETAIETSLSQSEIDKLNYGEDDYEE